MQLATVLSPVQVECNDWIDCNKWSMQTKKPKGCIFGLCGFECEGSLALAQLGPIMVLFLIYKTRNVGLDGSPPARSGTPLSSASTFDILEVVTTD